MGIDADSEVTPITVWSDRIERSGGGENWTMAFDDVSAIQYNPLHVVIVDSRRADADGA